VTITAGIDLAAEPKNTAVAIVDWSGAAPVVRSIDCPADDALITARCRDTGAAKIGIDCPLGWPEDFIAFITAHRAGAPVASADTIAARRPLAYRATDVHCQALGMRPLSVSADRIGHAAFRCAGLMPLLNASTDRSGAGLVVETYPAGSLLRWGGFAVHGYKGAAGAERLKSNAARLRESLSLTFAEPANEQLFDSTDHAFDAVVAAITARLAMVGAVEPVPAALQAVAEIEGWIVIPTAALNDLAAVCGP
jgi:predicted nuclease with RNAse H fold